VPIDELLYGYMPNVNQVGTGQDANLDKNADLHHPANGGFATGVAQQEPAQPRTGIVAASSEVKLESDLSAESTSDPRFQTRYPRYKLPGMLSTYLLSSARNSTIP